MQVRPFFTSENSKAFLKALQGKKADFLLTLSNTKTALIEGITQAGIPGYIHLTPTLDAEFVLTGNLYSIPKLPSTPTGVPTPALITKAIANTYAFSSLECVDLGLEVSPQASPCYELGLRPSGRIDEGAGINAKTVFEKGQAFAKEYKLKGDYLILAESTPAGTTTANASVKALGYACDGMFASSFKDAPNSIKEKVIQKSLTLAAEKEGVFNKLSIVSDNMLLFNAGFISEFSKRGIVILAGGTQMAAVLLILDAISKEQTMDFNEKNIALMTTKWIAKDEDSNLKQLLKLCSYKTRGYWAHFDFSSSENTLLKRYDEGEAKEGVGAGAALCYALVNSTDKDVIIRSIEAFCKG